LIYYNIYMSRYELGLCQKYNAEVHGFNIETSSLEVLQHNICLLTFNLMVKEEFLAVQLIMQYHKCTIEIVETHLLSPGNELIAIYKTFWLRIFQRICRKWVTNKQYARSSRMYSYLLKREYQNTKINI